MNGLLAPWLPWIETLGRVLVHFVWQGALLSLIYAAIRNALSPSHSEARYTLGLIALTMLALCPIGTFWLLHARAETLAVTLPPVATHSIAAHLSASAPAVQTTMQLEPSLLPWLVLAWLAGVTLMSWRTLRQWQNLERIARQLAKPFPLLDSTLQALITRFEITAPVRLLISPYIDTPTLIGWLKPIILLPTAVALRFPRQQIELILAHELGHLRRYDHFVNLAQAVLETLLFYHPVVHWISRHVRNEREICCDRLVLQLTESKSYAYVRTLTALEELRQCPTHLAMAATGGILLDRVRLIVDAPSPRLATPRPTLGLWALLGISVMGIPLVKHIRDSSSDELITATRIFQHTPINTSAITEFAPKLPVPFKNNFSNSIPSSSTPAVTNPVDNELRSITPQKPAITYVADAIPPPFPSREELINAETHNSLLSIKTADLSISATDLLPRTSAPTAPLDATQESSPGKPKVLHAVAPEYPHAAFSRQQEGEVQLEFSVSTQGTVRDLRIISATPGVGFTAAAERALRQWRFDPSTLSADKNVRYQQTFQFTTNNLHQTSVKRITTIVPDTSCHIQTGSRICRPAGEETNLLSQQKSLSD